MNESFQNFLEKCQALIVDSSSSSRVAMRRTLEGFGVKPEFIFHAKNVAEAERFSSLGIVKLVLSDYDLDDGLGTSLRSKFPKALFVLVSANSTKAAVARAAEEKVDNFIFKPYHRRNLHQILQETYERAVAPSASVKQLKKGIEALRSNALAQAIEIFQKLKNDHDVGSDAAFCLGEIRKWRKNTDENKEYEYGLSQNPVHFRCLFGLYTGLSQQGAFHEAYQVLKKIVTNFPEDQERLAQAAGLAIYIGSFRDVASFAQVHNLMVKSSPKLKNHIASALSVAGRQHLLQKEKSQAMALFMQALKIGNMDAKLVRYIFGHLRENKMDHEARELMKVVDIGRNAKDRKDQAA